MTTATWWPKISTATQRWLIDNTDTVTLPRGMDAEIIEAGGFLITTAWTGDRRPLNDTDLRIDSISADWIRNLTTVEVTQ